MKQQQQGFTLIEVLVASFIIIVGVLGVAAAQTMSLKNNQSAYFRSQANFLVADLLDRMRANTEAYDTGKYNSIDTTNALPAAQSCITAPAGCGVDNLATHDIREWMQHFPPHNTAPLIPGSSATVSTNTAAGIGGTGDVTITIKWDETVGASTVTREVKVEGRI